MFKKQIILILFFFLTSNYVFSNDDVFISVYVDDKIITNIDIKKESGYLKILNPNLEQLETQKIKDIAKKSLINEIIKKEEIKKFLDLTRDNPLEDQMLGNLYNKLNIEQEAFENILSYNKTYTINEVKEKLKVEIFWNDLIYLRYKNQVKIDKNSLLKKIESISNDKVKEYSLLEIIFEKNKDEELKFIINKIKNSISEIGFNNTANIYSISDSSKFGGKIGWIEETSLSKKITDELDDLKIGEYTNTIQLGNNFLILMIDDMKIKKVEINKEDELQKLIKFETTKQLTQFSKIFFNKSKINYRINEN
jgi:peptidyl-prolyl cis-trans isomerase SurA